MSRVLLIDTSFAARPIHDWLLAQGHDVWSIGNRPGDVLAARCPEKYLQDSYADVGVVQAHVDRLGITHVVPGCTDVSIETALRLQGIESSYDSVEVHDQLADKSAFRALCARLDLPAPRVVDASTLPHDGLLIAKPVDAFSGRGISVFHGLDPEAARSALAGAQAESPTRQAILETYVEGQLLSYSAFIEGGQVADATIVREDGSVTPYAVDVSHVVWDFPAKAQTVLKAAVEAMAQALLLVDGLLHVQFIWDGTMPAMIEVCRRCPGDLYSSLIQLSTGKTYAGRFASYFMGARLDDTGFAVPRHILRHTVTANHAGFEGVMASKPLPVIEYYPLAMTGRVPPAPDRIDRVGLLFAEYPTGQALEVACTEFLSRTACRTACAHDLAHQPASAS